MRTQIYRASEETKWQHLMERAKGMTLTLSDATRIVGGKAKLESLMNARKVRYTRGAKCWQFDAVDIYNNVW